MVGRDEEVVRNQVRLKKGAHKLEPSTLQEDDKSNIFRHHKVWNACRTNFSDGYSRLNKRKAFYESS